MLNLIGLLDLDADAHGVDARLDQDALVFVARNRQWGQEDLRRCLGFDLGDIVPLGGLRGEVGQRQRSCQGASDALEVRPQGLRLVWVSNNLLELVEKRVLPWLLYISPLWTFYCLVVVMSS